MTGRHPTAGIAGPVHGGAPMGTSADDSWWSESRSPVRRRHRNHSGRSLCIEDVDAAAAFALDESVGFQLAQGPTHHRPQAGVLIRADLLEHGLGKQVDQGRTRTT